MVYHFLRKTALLKLKNKFLSDNIYILKADLQTVNSHIIGNMNLKKKFNLKI